MLKEDREEEDLIQEEGQNEKDPTEEKGHSKEDCTEKNGHCEEGSIEEEDNRKTSAIDETVATHVADMVEELGAVHKTVITGSGQGVSDDHEISPRSSTQQSAPEQPPGSFTNTVGTSQPVDKFATLCQAKQPELEVRVPEQTLPDRPLHSIAHWPPSKMP